MPLVHASSKAAFYKNMGTELKAGKSRKQALAIAYSVQQRAGGAPAKTKAKKRK